MKRASLTIGLILAGSALIPAGAAARDPNADIVVQGKVYCPVKRPVLFPFGAVIADVRVKPGQAIKAGDVLVRYRLPPAVALELRRRLADPDIPRLESDLAELEEKLATAEAGQRELEKLAAQAMAPAEELNKAKRRIQGLVRQREAWQKALAQKRKLIADDVALLKEQLGEEVAPDRVPEEVSLTAPIGGHVLTLSPDVRPRAEVGKNAPALQIGAMDPICVRALVHEIEAMRLSPGDKAEVRLESLPGRSFKAEVAAIAWAPPPADRMETPTYYEVELTLPNPDLLLREGLKAEIVLHGSRETR